MKRLLLSALLLASLAIPASAETLQCMFPTTPTTVGTATISTDNYNIGLIGLEISVSCSTSTVAYYVVTPDSSSKTYDLGLYCVSGTCTPGQLYVHTGALSGSTFTPPGSASTIVTQSWTGQTPVTLPAGVYAVGVGTDCSGADCAQIGADEGGGAILPFFVASGDGTYSAGLPASVTPPQINPVADASNMPSLLIY